MVQKVLGRRTETLQSLMDRLDGLLERSQETARTASTAVASPSSQGGRAGKVRRGQRRRQRQWWEHQYRVVVLPQTTDQRQRQLAQDLAASDSGRDEGKSDPKKAKMSSNDEEEQQQAKENLELLLRAIRGGYLDKVKEEVEKESGTVDLATAPHGYGGKVTILGLAITQGMNDNNMEIVEFLIDKGAICYNQ